MSRFPTLIALTAALSLGGVAAKAAVFTSLATFQQAVPHASLIEDFETRGPTNTQLLQVLGTNQVFTTLAPGARDLIVTANHHDYFDIPGGHTTSRVLTAFTSEDFRDIFTTANHVDRAPVHAVGFDVLLTNASTTTIRFFGDPRARITLATLVFAPDADPNNNIKFVGFTSDLEIAGFDFVTNDPDDHHNSGIDNIYALPAGELPPVAGVPEPASWALMLLGFGLVGATARRRVAGPVTA